MAGIVMFWLYNEVVGYYLGRPNEFNYVNKCTDAYKARVFIRFLMRLRVESVHDDKHFDQW